MDMRHKTPLRLAASLCLLLAVLAAAGPARGETAVPVLNASGNRNIRLAVDPTETQDGYSAILYDNHNGLPTSEANAIAQTAEGFIWIGSYAGLIRYDGNTFERIESDEGILNTRCLFVDSQCRLWIGTNDFGLFLMEDGRLRRVDQKGDLVSVSIRTIAEDPQGVIWVGTAAGVFSVDTDMKLAALRDERIAGETIVELRADGEDRLAGCTYGGDLFVLKDGAVLTFLTHEECGIGDINAVLPDPESPGLLYLAAEDPETKSACLFHGTPEDRFASAKVIDIAPLSYVERLEAIGGSIWICAGNGAGRWDGSRVLLLKNVPMDKSVGHVLTDFEGNLWFTSSRQCVMKIVPNQFTDLFELYGLAPDVVNSTCLLDGRLFMGTDDSGLVVLENGKKLDSLPLTKAATASGRVLPVANLLDYLKNERVRSVIRDSRDRLWIGTWRHRHGLICYDHGKMTVYTTEDGLLSNLVRTVFECEDGSILAAEAEGMNVIRDGRVTASYGAAEGLAVTNILTLAEGFRHELLLGSDGGGIYVVEPDGIRKIGLDDGLKSEVILRIKRSRFRDVYWIATGNSIAFMTPDFRVTTVDRFPYSNNYDFYETSRGDLWVLSSNGVYVVPVEELLANGQINSVFYGIPSGLPFIATSNSFSELTDEGELYIAAVKGAVRVNIEKSAVNLGNLRVGLPFADINGKRVYPDETGAFTVPYGTLRLTLYPYVFNYSLIDPQVSYRLDGFEQETTTVSRSQLTPVSYTNLPEGEYRFMLRVEDPVVDGTVEASYRIVKEKLLSNEAVGTVIMDVATLFLMGGLLAYTSMYRRRGGAKDKLFFALIVIVMVLAEANIASLLMQKRQLPSTGTVLWAANTVYMAELVLFHYFFVLFVDFCLFRDMARLSKKQFLYAIPALLYLIFLAVNLATGHVFTVDAENTILQGPLYFAFFVPIVFYIVIEAARIYRLAPRQLTLFFLIMLVWGVWRAWYRGISSIAFLYAMFLVWAQIQVVKRPSVKEGTP